MYEYNKPIIPISRKFYENYENNSSHIINYWCIIGRMCKIIIYNIENLYKKN